MTSIRTNARGFSALELLVALAIITALTLLTAPPLIEVVRNSRINGAARRVASDLRQARAKAVGTGWQYRLVGVSAGASDSRRNQYRIMSRTSAAVTWPLTAAGPSSSATLVVGEWVDVDNLFPSVELNPGDTGEFALAFGTRGSPIEMSLSFSPLQVIGEQGQKAISVSNLGNVRVD